VAELFLVLAARADLVATVIRPALDAGRLVLADRYDHSTRAYQVGARGLDAEAVRVANALATGGLRPDVTLILDADPAVGRARQAAAGKRPDRMELEDDDFHRRVHAAYRAERGPGVIHLGADRAPEAVLADAWAALAAARPDHFR
jgi:dTMP kinase